MDTPTIITLNLTDCKHIDDMHLRIKQAFHFPDYYGENWDAFWDLIDGMRENTIVEIQGISSLPERLKEEAEKMIVCLEDNKIEMQKLKQCCPDFDCRFDYRFMD